MKGIETTQDSPSRSELLSLNRYRIVRMNLTAVVDVLPEKTLVIIYYITYKYFCNSSIPSPPNVVSLNIIWYDIIDSPLIWETSVSVAVLARVVTSTYTAAVALCSLQWDMHLLEEPQEKELHTLQQVNSLCTVLILCLSHPFKSYAPGFPSGDK